MTDGRRIEGRKSDVGGALEVDRSEMAVVVVVSKVRHQPKVARGAKKTKHQKTEGQTNLQRKLGVYNTKFPK